MKVVSPLIMRPSNLVKALTPRGKIIQKVVGTPWTVVN